MSQPGELLAIYVDGETKTGKGAAGAAIASGLQESGLAIYYDVAGDFYRRYVSMVRHELGLQEADELTASVEMQQAAQKLYDSGKAFDILGDYGDLQRPIISRSVPLLGELAIAQQAGAEWFAKSLDQALQNKSDVLVLDGRNPRARIEDQVATKPVAIRTALDLYMFCDAEEAARRGLLAAGITSPSAADLAHETASVNTRRQRDRTRTERPLLAPTIFVPFNAAESDPMLTVTSSWHGRDDVDPPLTITVDNTNVSKPLMLEAVVALSKSAVSYLRASSQEAAV